MVVPAAIYIRRWADTIRGEAVSRIGTVNMGIRRSVIKTEGYGDPGFPIPVIIRIIIKIFGTEIPWNRIIMNYINRFAVIIVLIIIGNIVVITVITVTRYNAELRVTAGQ
jgi:hypothetical protein